MLEKIQRQVRLRQDKEEAEVADVWMGRLDETYHAARKGLRRAESDSEKWTAAVGFLSQMNKAVETGLKATGKIGDGGLGQHGRNNVNIEQVIILTQLPAPGSQRNTPLVAADSPEKRPHSTNQPQIVDIEPEE